MASKGYTWFLTETAEKDIDDTLSYITKVSSASCTHFLSAYENKI